MINNFFKCLILLVLIHSCSAEIFPPFPDSWDACVWEISQGGNVTTEIEWEETRVDDDGNDYIVGKNIQITIIEPKVKIRPTTRNVKKHHKYKISIIPNAQTRGYMSDAELSKYMYHIDDPRVDLDYVKNSAFEFVRDKCYGK